MLITIKDSRIIAVIGSTGAQFISLRDASGREYIQQHNSKYWKRYSPLLFPVMGNYRNDRIILEDRIYATERHGLCRERDPDMSQETSLKVAFPMGDTPDTHKTYPYAFHLSLVYELKDGVPFMKYQVENRDQRDMQYTIGVHPGLSCPMEKGYVLEDYQLMSEKEENTVSTPYDLDQLRFAPSRTSTMLKGSILPPSREVSEYDTIFFGRLDSRAVSILNPATGRSVKVEFPGFETVAFQTLCLEPASYLRIEPRNGSGTYENEDDQFSHRHHIQRLCLGDDHSYVMTIRILERFSK